MKLQIYVVLNHPYSKITHNQVKAPLEGYTGVAHSLSANSGLWPAEVILSQWDFIFLLFLVSLQIKFPLNTK